MDTLDRLEVAMKRAVIEQQKADRAFKILKIMVVINYLLTLIALVVIFS